MCGMGGRECGGGDEGGVRRGRWGLREGSFARAWVSGVCKLCWGCLGAFNAGLLCLAYALVSHELGIGVT